MSKKLLIPINDLPAPSMTNSSYEIRYRVTSDDRNRFSAWTPIFTVDPQLEYYVEGDLFLQYVQNGAVTASWAGVSIMKEYNGGLVDIGTVDDYDVWIQWSGSGGANNNTANWIYQGRISAQSATFTVPPLYFFGASSGVPQYISVEIYRPSKERARNVASGFRMYTGSLDISSSSISAINTQITNLNTSLNTNVSSINSNITTLYAQDNDNFAASFVL